FVNRRFSFADQSPAVITQASHTLGDRDFSQLMSRGSMKNERTNLVTDAHDLEHALPAAIARALAVATSGAAIEHIRHEIAELLAQRPHFRFRHLLLALLADQADKPLRDDHFERRRDQVWLDAHVDQSRRGAG